MAEDLADLELMLNRFLRLLGELVRGRVTRTCFQTWEIEVIVDFQETALRGKRRLEILRQYERAVRRQMQTGPGPPMKLSVFLQQREARRLALKGQPLAALQSDIDH